MGSAANKKTPSNKRRASTNANSPSKAVKATAGQSPAASSSQTSVEASARDTAYTHHLPTTEQRKGNGRRVGRSLIMWNRPRMAEKLLLHLYYECVRHKVQVPWDAIAHRLRPGSSGAAIMQHLNRLRKDLISEGHLVPPVAQKASSGTPYDATIRGYVRSDTQGEENEAVRPVKYDEKLEDPKFNLPDSFSISDETELLEEGDFADLIAFDENATEDERETGDEPVDSKAVAAPAAPAPAGPAEPAGPFASVAPLATSAPEVIAAPVALIAPVALVAPVAPVATLPPVSIAAPAAPLAQLAAAIAEPGSIEEALILAQEFAQDFLIQGADGVFSFEDSINFDELNNQNFVPEQNKIVETVQPAQPAQPVPTAQPVQPAKPVQTASGDSITPGMADKPVDDDSPDYGVNGAANPGMPPPGQPISAIAGSAAPVPPTPAKAVQAPAPATVQEVPAPLPTPAREIQEPIPTPTPVKAKVEIPPTILLAASIAAPAIENPAGITALNSTAIAQNAALAYPAVASGVNPPATSAPAFDQAIFNSAAVNQANSAFGGMMFPPPMFILGPNGMMMPMPLPMTYGCPPMVNGPATSAAQFAPQPPFFGTNKNGAVPGENLNATAAAQFFDQNSFNIFQAAAAAAAASVNINVQQFGIQGLNPQAQVFHPVLGSILQGVPPQTGRVTSASGQNSPAHGSSSAAANPHGNASLLSSCVDNN
ncbi:hypothetical protein ESCO_005420 [Escovopsis weberi]|uniref:Uncharacterized protein n=1 Tax=Escovopsis weberi TaxID=150374 RepID=A0A0M8N0C2_ESCWE|nr:hypothetical protein ESCO_005420 [Escovopsis weberi]